MTAPHSILDIALNYIARGWSIVPINHKEKAPKIKAWEKLDITPENAATSFNNAAANIGVLLGTRSGGLTDIDLDCAEAVTLAPHFLPHTNAVFGRASKPSSHYLYVIDDALEKATEQLKDENKATIIELRMGGGSAAAQTVFPGSTHPSGETIEWVKDGAPARSNYQTLKAAITKIAIGAILIRKWPKGSGHEAAQTIGGFLARLGWDAEDIGDFVGILTHVAGELPTAEDNKRTAKNAAEAHIAGKNSFGFPKLTEDWGEESAKAIAKILGYKGEKTASNAGPGAIPVIVSIKKITSDKPIWFVVVEGSNDRMTINDARDLVDYKRFKVQCYKQLDLVFMTMKPAEWDRILRDAKSKTEVVAAEEDTTARGAFKELLEDFLTNRTRGVRREDLLRGAPWEDEEKRRHLFTMKALMAFLERGRMRNVELNDVREWIKGLGGESVHLTVKNIRMNCWSVPSAAINKAPKLDFYRRKRRRRYDAAWGYNGSYNGTHLLPSCAVVAL